MLTLRSSAVSDGGTLPVQHTHDGPDLSPPLSFGGVPDGSRSLALTVEDPDAPGGTWVHWLLWNIPVSARTLPQAVPRARNLPDGSKQGRTSYGGIGWSGPAPPPGSPHRYVFTLHALDVVLDLPGASSADALRIAMAAHLLDTATLTALYGRTTWPGATG